MVRGLATRRLADQLTSPTATCTCSRLIMSCRLLALGQRSRAPITAIRNASAYSAAAGQPNLISRSLLLTLQQYVSISLMDGLSISAGRWTPVALLLI